MLHFSVLAGPKSPHCAAAGSPRWYRMVRSAPSPDELPMRVSPAVGMAAALAAFLSPVETLRAAPPSGVVAVTMPSSAQWVVHEVIPGERLVEVAERYAV